MYKKMWYDLMTFLKQNEVHKGKLQTWQPHEIIGVMDCIERNCLREELDDTKH